MGHRAAILLMAVAVAGTVLFSALPASADVSPAPPTQAPPGPPGTYQPAPPAPAYPPSAYPPGYPPAPYGSPPPSGYYAPPPGYYVPVPPPGPPPGPLVLRSSAATVAGGVGVAAGTPLFFVGLGLAIANDACRADDPGCVGSPRIALGLGIAGAVLVVVGIPLLVYGAKRVPAGSTAAAALLRPLPRWVGVPAGHGWRWEL